MRRMGILGRAVGLAFVCALLLAAAASAATLTVTSHTDSNNPGSLRYEIGHAEAGDTVALPGGTTPYTITLGEIQITNPMTIEGGSGGASTIQVVGGASRAFEITSGVLSTQTVTFQNLTIEDGKVTAAPGGGGILDDSGLLDLSGVTMTGNSVALGADTNSNVGGGAVYSDGGNLTITNSVLDGNSVTDAGNSSDKTLGGAAVFEQGSGTVTITGSTIDSNTVSIGASNCCDGGAVFQDVNAALTVSNSHLDHNTFTVTGSTSCCDGGAAIYMYGGDASPTTITASTLNDDTANITDMGVDSCCDGGGAIFQDANGSSVASDLTIGSSTLEGDETTATSGHCCSGGGAIASFTAVNVSDSTISTNTSNVTDGSCCDGGGAINIDAGTVSTITGTELFGNKSTVDLTGTPSDTCCSGGGAIEDDNNHGETISGSDLSGNTSDVSSGIDSGGGALYEDSSGVDTIVNSTFSGNVSNATGTDDGGGALYFDDRSGPQALSFVTIAGNSAGSGDGGGIYSWGGPVDLKGSIVAANTAAAGNDCAGADNGSNNPFSFTSLGYNLEDSPDSCSFTATGDKVVASGSLGLGPLAANGGSTLTRSLLSGSAAINAIPIASCTDQSSPTPVLVTTDQRGIARPQPVGGNCDIGAFEFGDSDISLAGSIAPTTLKVKQHATVRLTVKNAGPVPATATTLALTLPKGLKLISATPATGSCAGDTCSLGALAVTGGDSVAVTVEPTAPGRLTIKANAATTSADPNTGNNSASFALTAKLTPALSKVKQSHKTWREGSKLAHLAKAKKAKKPPVGTTFSFTLNENAKVKLVFTAKHKKKASGTVSFNAKAGKRKITFDGRLSRSKKLKSGSYTVTITASASGLKSKPAKLSFKIASG
jgi:uncharacterized repeat protein (TIGR01451 family)